jgi:hypothetical protein
MQVFLSRKEIRRQMRASLGQTTDEGLAGMNRDKFDTFIQTACLKAHAELRGVNQQREATFDLGIEQKLVEYPDQAGPGSLIEAAIYDSVGKGYWPLRRKTRRAHLSDDQAAAAGGADFAAEKGMPKWIEETKDGWSVYPTTDQAYKLRVQYVIRQAFTDDDEESTVDAQLILSYALHLETRTYDAEASKQHLADYRERLVNLKGWEQAGAAISYDADADFDQDPDYGDEPPRWDTRPSRQ